ncbi:MAG: CotH kinase family protein, partial [Planctomycetota bacterium]
VLALCYEPFACTRFTGPLCPTPDDDNLPADMNEWVNIQGLLAMEAIDALNANTDGLFNHYKNNFFLDFDDGSGRKRMYLPWDVDSVMGQVNTDIYENDRGATTWQQIILGNPTLRSNYNRIIRDLINGPLSEANIHAFIDMIEPVLTDALVADPYNQIETPGLAGVQERFSTLRDWISDRIVNVLAQVDADEPLPPSGDVLLQDGFEDSVWDTNWESPHNWVKDTTNYANGTSSACANQDNNGYFTCDALDTSDATAIHIRFWFMKSNTDAAKDLFLYFYNGTNYNLIDDLDTLGDDDVWLHYANTITDNQYFVSNFKLHFEATPETGENVWIDDILVTKEISSGCNSANLDGINFVNLKDFALLAGDWQLTGPELVGDINRDLTVNSKDLFYIVKYWLSECNQP